MDAEDLAPLRNHCGSIGAWAAGNFTLDENIDAADLAHVRNRFGFVGPYTGAPEAATLSLLAVSLLAFCRHRS